MSPTPLRTTLCAALAALFLDATAAASDWAQGFVGPSAWLGVSEVATFDDGSGEKLYLCTSDQFQTTHPGIVRRFDGSRWEPFGAEHDGRILASCEWDDGTGNALYLAGSFSQVGGVAAQSIVRFDGTNWTALGLGVAGLVEALVVHDDGSGPALYAAGSFNEAGGGAANYIARWNGAAWSSVGTIYGHIYDLEVFDDGGGAALYAAGSNLWFGGVESESVARWDGTSWSFLPRFAPTTLESTALEVFDSGGGPALHAAHYVYGNVWRVGRWNGTAWTTLTGDFGARLSDLKGFGGALYAVGEFQTLNSAPGELIARWNGVSWSTLANTLQAEPYPSTDASLRVFDPVGGPPLLVIGGLFYSTGDERIANLAQWDGTRVSNVGIGQGILGGAVAHAVFDDGTGSALFLGGYLSAAAAIDLDYIARWNGATFTKIPIPSSSQVNALTVFDDGTGPALFAGSFGVHRWNGASWTAWTSGLPPFADVRSLCVWNRAGNPSLVATTFAYPDQARVFYHDGSAWVQLGGLFNGVVNVVAVHDSGTGQELFVAGDFTNAGGTPASRIARWQAGAWQPLGGGASQSVRALLSHDDGSGPALYVGGSFATVNGIASPAIARWNAGTWASVGAGLGAGSIVESLCAFDEGGGAELVAGGDFDASVSNGIARGVARWNGVAWSALGAGLRGTGSYASLVASYRAPDAQRDALHVGGYFSRAGEEIATCFAIFGAEQDGRALCFGDGVQQACPCGNASPVGAGAGCRNSQGFGATLRSRGTASVAADTFELVGASMTPTSFVSYFQGTYALGGGIGTPFTAGLRCAGGSVIRIGATQNVGGASELPNAASTTSISVRGAVPAVGGTRVYQAWHRDALGMCGFTSNLTNAVLVTWKP